MNFLDFISFISLKYGSPLWKLTIIIFVLMDYSMGMILVNCTPLHEVSVPLYQNTSKVEHYILDMSILKKTCCSGYIG